MGPRIVKLTRVAFALSFLAAGSYLFWAARNGQLSLPELAAGAGGELALGAFVAFCWPWRENRTLSYGLLAVMWAALGACSWLQVQDSFLATVCGFVALAYVASCSLEWKTGRKALTPADVHGQ